MTSPASEPIDPELLSAVQEALAGEADSARSKLVAIWSRLPSEDHFHRCVLAHYLADLQPTPEDELMWDLTALRAALAAEPGTFDNRIPEVTWQNFLPSLYLNVAASHERCDQLDAAREHATLAEQHQTATTSGPLGDLTRNAIARLTARLNAL